MTRDMKHMISFVFILFGPYFKYCLVLGILSAHVELEIQCLLMFHYKRLLGTQMPVQAIGKFLILIRVEVFSIKMPTEQGPERDLKR